MLAEPTSLCAPPSIPLYWFRRGRGRTNFGDALSPIVVRALSGRAVRFEPAGPRLIAIGSVLNVARSDDEVWGAGFRDVRHGCAAGVRVHAVRGPLTRRRLTELGIACPEVYGDPAMLLPWLYGVGEPRRSGVGVIPHYVDAIDVRRRLRARPVQVLDICAGIEKVIAAATRCEVVLSSSLHGCILGDAYGIPTAWVRISDRVRGDGFKFRDHFAATGRSEVVVDWRERFDLDRAVAVAIRAPRPAFDPRALLKAFPYRRAGIGEPADLPARAVSD